MAGTKVPVGMGTMDITMVGSLQDTIDTVMERGEIETGYVRTDSSHCTKCLLCADVCAAEVFGMKKFLWMKYFYVGDPLRCIGCMECVAVCQAGVFITK